MLRGADRTVPCQPRAGGARLRFIRPANRTVIAYVRQHENETIVCVANLSRSAQAAEIDLSSVHQMNHDHMVSTVTQKAQRRQGLIAIEQQVGDQDDQPTLAHGRGEFVQAEDAHRVIEQAQLRARWM